MSSVRLTPADDLFLHQTPYTLDTVCTTDPDYRERVWMSVSDTQDQEIMVDCGMGHYPNRNVQEAWAGVCCGDAQHNLRMSRHLRPDLQTMAVRPLRIEVAEPLRRVRYILDENPSGIAFDIVFHTDFAPHIEDHHLEIRDGRIAHDLSRYNIVGHATGTLVYPGGKVDLGNGRWRGGRDHSWGVQPDQQNTSQPTQNMSRHGTLYTLCYAQFSSWAAFFYMMERAPGIYQYLSGSVMRRGDDGDDVQRIVSVEHDYRWNTDSSVQQAQSASLSLLTEDGARHAFSCEFYRPRYFLRSALYLGWKGWWQGADKGPYHFEHDIWDLSEQSALPEYAVAGGGYDHHALCRSEDGEAGHAAFEYFVTPGYPRYTELFEGS